MSVDLGIHDVGLFIVAGVLLNLTPGVDFVYVLSRASASGFRAGIAAALGIGAGCFVHIAAAGLGLSAVLASSATAFSIVKWIGAAYLLYMGVSMLIQRRPMVPAAAQSDGARDVPLPRIFWQGFLTNVLNPKVALFFLAFVPQFIDSHAPSKLQAFLVLGTLFNITGTLWNTFVAWAAASLSRHLTTTARVGVWLNRCLGGLFVALGVRLAIAQRG